VTELIKVLIVDDDKTWQAFLKAALQEKYDVKVAHDGPSGEALALEWQPDAILLDIEMPGKSGYEVCQRLKSETRTRGIPIIFLSAKTSLQEKIAGFELGADDYLIKPCEAELLQAKVLRSATLYREKRALDVKANDAQILAFEAMTSSADMGRSLRFAERTHAMTSFEKLAEGLFQTMAEFGLESSVMFMTNDGPRFFADSQFEMSPLEQDMFTAIHQEGRFCDFGRRTFCNFKLVSVLIKNMPLENPERYGRIKDVLPWVLGPADGKVGALNLHSTLVKQHEQVAVTIELLRRKLDSFAEGFSSGNKILAASASAIYAALPGDATQASYQELLDQIALNNRLGENLGSAQQLLAQLASEQEAINNQILKSTLNDEIELGRDEVFSSGVDFF